MDILISTSNENYEDKFLPWNDIVNTIPQIVSYFKGQDEVFPYANLMYMSGNYDELRGIILNSMPVLCIEGRYREIKYLSKLARISNIFTRDDLFGIYDIISFSKKNEDETRNAMYSLYEHEIRRQLLMYDDTGVDISIRVGMKSAFHGSLLPWLLRQLEEGCSMVGVDLVWEHLESTIASPGHLKGRAKIRGAQKANSGEDARVFRERAALLVGAIGALFGAISAIPAISQMQSSNIENKSKEIGKYVQLEGFYASIETKIVVRMDKNGQLVWPAELPQPKWQIPNSPHPSNNEN
jgi:hypothetical protein